MKQKKNRNNKSEKNREITINETDELQTARIS